MFALLFLSACSNEIPRMLRAPVGTGVIHQPNILFHREPYGEDENGRIVYFTGYNGKFYEVNVAKQEIVNERCQQATLACVSRDGSKIISAWLVDKFVAEIAVCAYIMAIDFGWNDAMIQDEFSDEKLGLYSFANLAREYGDKPARREVCGPAPYYTGMGWSDWTTAVRYGDHAGGRLLTLDEWRHLMAIEGLDGSEWKP